MQIITPVSPRFTSKRPEQTCKQNVQFAGKSDSGPKESKRTRLSESTLVQAFFHLPGLRWLGNLLFVSAEDRKQLREAKKNKK